MLELLIIIGIVIIGIIFSIVTSFEDYFDFKSHGIKKITKKGKTFIAVSLIAIILYVIQYNLNEAKYLLRETKIKIEKKKSDSTYQKRLEESNKLIINTFAEGLAKYALKYDSASRTIEKLIIESSKDKIIIQEAEPFLSLCKDNPIDLINTHEDLYEFNLYICNSTAPSRNVKAMVYVVSVNSINKLKFCKEFDLFQSNQQFDTNAKVSQQLLVPNIEKLKLCYFIIKGSWSNSTESKEFNIDQIYHYNFETKESGGVTASHEKQIREFLNVVRND